MISNVSCLFEVVPAFPGLEEIADVAEGAPEGVVAARLGFPEQGLELGKSHFD